MNEFRELLLDVWREACRHIEITHSTGAIAGFLVPHVPIQSVIVRRIDPQRHYVETVAVGPLPLDQDVCDARNECQPGQMEAILNWCRTGEVLHGHGCAQDHSRAADRLLAAVLSRPIPAGVLAGPLALHDDRFGVLLLVARPQAVFEPQHVELVQVLLEPFAAALENDRHVAEMAALREAAEADKRSLLKRLGRDNVGGDTIVGIGSGLRAVMERIALVSKSDLPVLIFGETGSGKEVVARAIHNGSPRAQRPFIRVNCGAIPHELIDSQLFGHEKGAFTGAIETRQGWFERADGGTLLLDELGELPLAAQVRLLRILQDGWLDRVGGQRPISVDVRIVAATHRDLPGMVAAGQFREDLWYRLAVFPIVIPPLRERREDIPELARHFARRAATRFGLYPAEPTQADIDLLMSYSWPGNIRELATVIDRAAILGDGKQLEMAKSLGVPTHPTPTAGVAPSFVEPQPAQPISAKEIVPLDDAIRRHIGMALSATGGRIEGPRGAAKLLEINPHTLRGRMRKLKIDWKEFRA
ncbi:MAG: sigma 54-interacting transcriptional regulator [Thermoguttaceae bacterium]|jgi:transcriptional regulator with GAF, ATPase, and Fis domain